MSGLESDILEALELRALAKERENRFDPQASRLVEAVVDPSSFEPLTPWVPRLKLVVVMAYSQKWERLAVMNKQALLNYEPKAHLAYACYWEGRRVDLTRAQALRLLQDGDLPPEVQDGVRAVMAEDKARQDAIDIDDVFAKLSSGPEHQLRGKKYEPRTFRGDTY